MLSYREQRQLEQPAAFKMRCDAAQRIGAGDDDSAVARILVIVKCDRFKPQHWRQHDLEALGAQRSGRGLVVRMRTCDENSHASNSWPLDFCVNGRLHSETSQC